MMRIDETIQMSTTGRRVDLHDGRFVIVRGPIRRIPDGPRPDDEPPEAPVRVNDAGRFEVEDVGEVERIIARADVAILTDVAFPRLTHFQWECVRMFHIEGYPTAEIARVLGTTVKSVQMARHKAITRIRSFRRRTHFRGVPVANRGRFGP